MKTEFIELDKSLETPVENDVQRILREALMRLEGGAKWYRGWLTNSPAGSTCTWLAAAYTIDDRELPDSKNRALRGECTAAFTTALGVPYLADVYRWNDAPERKFSDVEALYAKAIELAGHKALPQ